MEKGNHFLTAATCLAAAGAIAYTNFPNELNEYLPTLVDKVAFCGTYLATTALPDIDQGIRLIKHRTFTHSFLFLIILFIPGLLRYSLLGPFFASFHHILMDSFSAQGVAWFWPFQGYLRYDNGKSIKRGYHIKLYHSRSTAESIVAILFSLLNIAIAATVLLYYFRLI